MDATREMTIFPSGKCDERWKKINEENRVTNALRYRTFYGSATTVSATDYKDAMFLFTNFKGADSVSG